MSDHTCTVPGKRHQWCDACNVTAQPDPDVEALVRRLHDEEHGEFCDEDYARNPRALCGLKLSIRSAVLAGRASRDGEVAALKRQERFNGIADFKVMSAEVSQLRAKIRIADERTEREIAKTEQLRALLAAEIQAHHLASKRAASLEAALPEVVAALEAADRDYGERGSADTYRQIRAALAKLKGAP